MVPVVVGMHFVCPVVRRRSYILLSLLHVALCTCHRIVDRQMRQLIRFEM
jgi:hypothetical protein